MTAHDPMIVRSAMRRSAKTIAEATESAVSEFVVAAAVEAGEVTVTLVEVGPINGDTGDRSFTVHCEAMP